MTEEYTMQEKLGARDFIARNVHKIQYNLTGHLVILMPSPTLFTTMPPSTSFAVQLEPTKHRAFFFDRYAEHMQSFDGVSRESYPVIVSRDASYDAEYIEPHRSLVIPLNVKNSGISQPSPDRFVFMLVSEAHGIYLQRYREWLPPRVIVVFPGASEFVVHDGVAALRIDTLCVLVSSRTSMAPKESLCMPPVYFGPWTNLNANFSGPRHHKTTQQTIDSESAQQSPQHPDDALARALARELLFSDGNAPGGNLSDDDSGGLFDDASNGKRKRNE